LTWHHKASKPWRLCAQRKKKEVPAHAGWRTTGGAGLLQAEQQYLPQTWWAKKFFIAASPPSVPPNSRFIDKTTGSVSK